MCRLWEGSLYKHVILNPERTSNSMNTRSIDRAIDLMSTPADYENYVSIKIKPAEGGCCCLNHWSKTWDTINEYIYPSGPVKNEGDVIIDKNKTRLVLECHETGPEIIVYLGFGTASIVLVKSVIDLIITILKARQNEYHNHSGKFKIIRRRQIKGEIDEEEIMELDLPLSEDNIKKLNEVVKENLSKTVGREDKA